MPETQELTDAEWLPDGVKLTELVTDRDAEVVGVVRADCVGVDGAE